MAVGMASDADSERLLDGLVGCWAVLEISFKFHSSCRHTHLAADALLKAAQEHGLTADRIAKAHARVHQAAIDVLGPGTDLRTTYTGPNFPWASCSPRSR